MNFLQQQHCVHLSQIQDAKLMKSLQLLVEACISYDPSQQQ